MKKLILTLLLGLLLLSGYSQKIDSVSNPLEKFFQENYDSTIFYHTYSYFKNNPDFYIVGKKDDTIYYYHYDKHPTQGPTKMIGPFKSGLTKFFVNRFINNNRFSKVYPIINLDDNFFWVNTEVLKGSLWEKIQSENIWNLVDDRSELLRNEPSPDILDGGGCSFKLITNNKVISLSYWVPQVYSKDERNHVRNRIVEIGNLLNDYYSTHKIQFEVYH